jgi:hypothetical protein
MVIAAFNSNLTPNGVSTYIGCVYGVIITLITMYNMFAEKIHPAIVIPSCIALMLIEYFVSGLMYNLLARATIDFMASKYGLGILIGESVGLFISFAIPIACIVYLIYQTYKKVIDEGDRGFASLILIIHPSLNIAIVCAIGLIGGLIQLICVNVVITVLVSSILPIALFLYICSRIDWNKPKEYDTIDL